MIARYIGIMLAWMIGAALADGVFEEREWTGVNGKSFRGRFVQLSADGLKAEFFKESGGSVVVAMANLSQSDRELIIKPLAKDGNAAPGDFKPEVQPDRTRMPVLKPKDFGCESGEEMVDALWVSLLWWNQEGVLPVAGNGRFEKKAESLHKSLSRLVAASGRTAATLEEAQKGVVEYFGKELKDLAACRTFVEQHDLSPARLSALASGVNAVILNMTMTYDNGRDFSASAVLESMSGTGRFVIHLAGKRLTGQVKALEKKSKEQNAVAPLEFVLDNRSELPEVYQRNDAVFKLGLPDHPWNGALVLKPYLYATPGKPAPLPVKNEFQDSGKKGGSDAGPHAGSAALPGFPVNFTSSVEVRREWRLADGKTFQGFPVFRPGQRPVLKSGDGKQLEVDSQDFMPEDRVAFEFWLATTGAPQGPARLDLTYQLDTPVMGSFEVRIFAEGNKGRVEVRQPDELRVLVFDMEDGAFISTGRGSGANPWRSEISGKFEQMCLLPRGNYPGGGRQVLDEFLNTTLPESKGSSGAVMPARFMRYALPPERQTFRNLQVDFVLMENPVVLAGLSQFLCQRTPSVRGGSPVLSSEKTPLINDADSVFAVLADCKMMPLGLKWTNVANSGYEEFRKKQKGDFTLKMIRAEMPDSFPADHFSIPEKAHAMAAGVQAVLGL